MSAEVITTAAVASNAECFHFTSQRSVTFWPSAAGATSKKVQSKIKNCNYSRQCGKDRVCVCEPSVRKVFVVVEALQTWTVLSHGHVHFSTKSDRISQGTALEPETARVPAWDGYR